MTEYILTSKEMSIADELTIKSGISSKKLMLQAGTSVFKNLPTNGNANALVVCGPGNNGGDGYVIAMLLSNAGKKVDVLSFDDGKKLSNDNQFYKDKLDDNLFIQNPADLSQYDYVVDGIFGTGLSRKLPENIIDFINKINMSKLDVYAIDVPTGINSDTSEIYGECFKCKKTITFFNKKICHFLHPGKEYCGSVVVEDIGIKENVLKKIMPKIKKNEPSIWIDQFPFPISSDHKYSRGMLVINTGPKYQTGAARLAGRSALRVGAGAVTMVCDEETAEILEPQISVELLSVIKEKNDFQKLLKDKRVSSVLIGPGNGVNDETKARTLMALAFVDNCVIDAEAIPRFIECLNKGVDFVQASRFIEKGVSENIPLHRKLAIKYIHTPILSFSSGFKWTDSTQGFRGYSKRILLDPKVAPFRKIFNTYELLAYMSYRIPRLGYRCCEIATIRKYPKGKIPTKINSLKDYFNLFIVLLKGCMGFYNP